MRYLLLLTSAVASASATTTAAAVTGERWKESKRKAATATKIEMLVHCEIHVTVTLLLCARIKHLHLFTGGEKCVRVCVQKYA